MVPGFEDGGRTLGVKEHKQSRKGGKGGKENWFIPRVSRKEGIPTDT